MKIIRKSAFIVSLGAILLAPLAANASLETLTATLTDAPKVPDANLVLTFPGNVDLAKSSIELIDSNSKRVPIERPELSENGIDVNVPLKTPLQPGTYTVIWHATSMDGRVNQGRYAFHVDP